VTPPPDYVDELVLEFLELTPAPQARAAYWEKKANTYKVAYQMAQRVVDQQATLIAEKLKRIRVLENAVRMLESQRSSR
jgi:hypothetical protein